MSRRLIWILYQPYKVFVLGPFVAINTLFLGTLTILLSLFLDPRRVSLICGVMWARLNTWATPMGVTIRGRENLDPLQSYVIVSNHQSHYDVFVLYGWLGVDFKWVMKQELRKVPGLGIGCEMVGHIFIDRSNRAAALKSLDDAKSKIVDGTSVMFFPEGTRSRSGKLLPFKKGAFKMAQSLELPILPLTINGTRDILPPDSVDLMPGRAEVIIHPPVVAAGLEDEELGKLMDEVRETIAGGVVLSSKF